MGLGAEGEGLFGLGWLNDRAPGGGGEDGSVVGWGAIQVTCPCVRSRDFGGVAWVASSDRIVRAAWDSFSERVERATDEGKRPNGRLEDRGSAADAARTSRGAGSFPR